MRASLIISGLCALFVGCATQAGGEGQGAAPASAVDRGRVIAVRECSRCHAIGPVGPSARAAAPPFRDVRLRYNELTFKRRMAEIAEGGHYEMPPLKLEPGQASDLAAYLESLGS